MLLMLTRLFLGYVYSRANSGPRVATLSDISSAGGAGAPPMGAGADRGHGHGDDDDDDSDDGERQEAESWFAGGERRYEAPFTSCDGLLGF